MSLFLTAIIPPEALSDQVDDIRKELSERYNIHAALKPPVHITLYRPLSIDPNAEQKLVKILRPLSLQHHPFEINLLNFDTFNIQTIFVNVQKNAALNALQKDVAAIYHRNKVDTKEPKSQSGFHPHITVAYRDIPPKVFPQIWEELKNRKFKRSFVAEHFSLLKHDGKRWQLFENFPLQKPQTLELF